MKHSRSGCRRTKEFFDLVFANSKTVIICLVVLLLLILTNDKVWSMEADMRGLGYTLSDSCLLLTKPILFGITIVPLIVYLFSVLLKYDFNPAGIIKRKNRQGFWLKQVSNLCAFSFLAAAYLTVCSCLISIFFTQGVCNWNKKTVFSLQLSLGWLPPINQENTHQKLWKCPLRRQRY